MELLDCITGLSHEFGQPLYVRGGGGNTSVKDASTLWVKPSGTTLATIKPTDFVALNRKALAKLYAVTPPSDPSAREAMVKEMMEKAVLPDSRGRASVEAPLHNTLSARYVVHTHPALVNGMTCAKNGKAACAALFAQALWLDYIDPGFTLCMQVQKEIQRYAAAFGREPAMIFLKNHGVFIAADEPNEIRKLYNGVITTLQRHYKQQGVPTDLTVGPRPDKLKHAAAEAKIRQAFGDTALALAAGGAFALPQGPISPDHIVYAKSYFMTEEPTPEAVQRFSQTHGYPPHIVAFDKMVFGVGQTQKKADLALEMALDGALVQQLAAAFGGIEYLTDRARLFIEQWEVESYRSKQIG